MRANVRNGNTLENNRELARRMVEIFRVISEESRFPVEELLGWKSKLQQPQLTLPLQATD